MVKPHLLTKKKVMQSVTFFNLLQNLHNIPAARAADSASAMDSAAAEIKIIKRSLVIRPARYRTHERELVEHDLTVVEVTFSETVGGFEIKRREGFAIYD
jgi:hypothetical protein